jgi:hypothetical protein
LSASVDAEVATLEGSIDQLRAETVAASGTLTSDIGQLRTETSAASGALDARITSLSTTAHAEITALEAAVDADVAALSAAIDAEVSARGAAVTSLSSSVDAAIVALSGDMVSRDATVLSTAQTYTDTAVSNLVNGAPELLDTLRELASAIGDDANFAVTMANNYATLSTALTNAANADDARLDVLETAFGTLTGASGVATLGTIAAQNYDSVSITGGTAILSSLSGATLFDCSFDAGTY